MNEPVTGRTRAAGPVWTSDHEATGPARAAAARGAAVDHARARARGPVPHGVLVPAVFSPGSPGPVPPGSAEAWPGGGDRRQADGPGGLDDPRDRSGGGGGARWADLDWDGAVETIRAADDICLVCHISPDGDALGSMLALAQALRSLGKRCVASFGEPFTVPASLRFLPGQELLIEPARMPAAPEVMITLDAAGAERLGSLAGRAARAGSLVVIDHHASNTGFGAVRLVDPAAAATAVLVDELIRRLGVPLTRDVAQCLYAGLASDTGSFKYPCTTPQVHDMAGRLLAVGVRPDAVSRELWDRAPFGYLMVLAGALGRARLERDAAGGLGLVWTTVERAERDSRGVPYDQLEGVIDQLRRTDEAEVAVVCKQNDQGDWYVSTRSKGTVDVGRACVALGGGGHRTAAAFTATGEPADILDRFRAALRGTP
ncbi:phosphoesterase [Actinomadura sp. NBRC 104412]|uniref:DHH family phosphoesterase n=1 Tax=Actinomadura sp. NBRC 104412 TaxID=3032203 RepID=UPI0024A41695|nr:bifunctional oligoribonuclease/PAP phosphatase NrnA [Actinomadura sp. NBRC 104412]GLZ04413.1 phosphoesterase [Actinomadura sp. NBRC 104412]